MGMIYIHAVVCLSSKLLVASYELNNRIFEVIDAEPEVKEKNPVRKMEFNGDVK